LVKQCTCFSPFFPVACDILSIPAPVECAFSVCGEASKAKRKSLADHYLG